MGLGVGNHRFVFVAVNLEYNDIKLIMVNYTNPISPAMFIN